MTRHTDTSLLYLGAADMLVAIGRLRDHETFDAPEYRCKFIEDEMRHHLCKMADALGFDLVKRVTAAEASALAAPSKEAA